MICKASYPFWRNRSWVDDLLFGELETLDVARVDVFDTYDWRYPK